ncbi:MAG: hypothetical protein WEC75_03850 [Dehalococcoidia bacterium]
MLITLAAVALAGCDSGERARAGIELAVMPEEVPFAVVWLGESYDSDGDGEGDMPLRLAAFVNSPPFFGPDGKLLRPQVKAYDLVYGYCTPSPNSGTCPVPITITLYDPCSAPLAEEVQLGTRQVRGVEAKVYGEGALWIETRDFTVAIQPVGATRDEVTEKAVRIAEELVGANEKASHISRETAFEAKEEPTSASPDADADADACAEAELELE